MKFCINLMFPHYIYSILLKTLMEYYHNVIASLPFYIIIMSWYTFFSIFWGEWYWIKNFHIHKIIIEKKHKINTPYKKFKKNILSSLVFELCLFVSVSLFMSHQPLSCKPYPFHHNKFKLFISSGLEYLLDGFWNYT